MCTEAEGLLTGLHFIPPLSCPTLPPSTMPVHPTLSPPRVLLEAPLKPCIQGSTPQYYIFLLQNSTRMSSQPGGLWIPPILWILLLLLLRALLNHFRPWEHYKSFSAQLKYSFMKSLQDNPNKICCFLSLTPRSTLYISTIKSWWHCMCLLCTVLAIPQVHPR